MVLDTILPAVGVMQRTELMYMISQLIRFSVDTSSWLVADCYDTPMAVKHSLGNLDLAGFSDGEFYLRHRSRQAALRTSSYG